MIIGKRDTLWPVTNRLSSRSLSNCCHEGVGGAGWSPRQIVALQDKKWAAGWGVGSMNRSLCWLSVAALPPRVIRLSWKQTEIKRLTRGQVKMPLDPAQRIHTRNDEPGFSKLSDPASQSRMFWCTNIWTLKCYCDHVKANRLKEIFLHSLSVEI